MEIPDSIPADRVELFESAVRFLGEPTVQNSPLTKKVEFLQKKGLSEQEIQHALKYSENVSAKSSSELQSGNSVASVPMNDSWYDAVPPPLPRRDWKDYFIMATTTVGLCYGIYEVTRRYVVPQLLPESKSKLEEDKQHIDQHFEKVDKLLEKFEQEQEEFRNQQVEKLKELDATIIKLQGALEDTTKTRSNINFEFRDLKLQVTELSKKIEEFKHNRESSTQLAGLHSDMESLKRLIKNSTFANGGSSLNNSSAPNGVPSAASIPSASEILAKMKPNVKKDEQHVEKYAAPVWKAGRMHNTSSPSLAAIPDWQKAAVSSKEQSPVNNAPNDVSDESSREDFAT
ncbi:Pex14p Ecym_3353 [Eremothecium cymbalariae DBVPG|uniref:Peroxisomal membrane protein PEX14 n=1 Tax=Eremothecium cymbalariae (strain CBS 270.75 / DBVPG 7215 / KCTC 17166 / NRRL Y-17582) TaxID=931890 RepID=G8JRS2_ERECY|nr:Hypothetical protein Ecym_3353 [Eremothecium cymbalariae DBVPG\